MQCKHPIITPNTGRDVPIPCGQCLNCRISKRRIWTHRMMLEASYHEHNSFLTLTYSDEHLPTEFHNSKTGQIYEANSVNPAHHKAFIDKLRVYWRRKTGKNLRFFVCGEYGEKSGRPHYHYALFGFPSCIGSGAVYSGRTFVPCTCQNCKFISDIWKKGHIYLGTLKQDSAQYVAGYVTKKLTQDNTKYQNDILCGRHPEFSRQSNRHGLGYQAAVDFGKKISPFVKDYSDIPPFLIHNGRKWPLGRYLKNVVLKNTKLPPLKEGQAIDIYKKNLHDLFESKKTVGLSKVALESNMPDVALRLINEQKSIQIQKHFDRKTKKGL